MENLDLFRIFDKAFPFGFLLDRHLTISHAGPALRKAVGQPLIGRSLADVIDADSVSGFKLSEPANTWEGMVVSMAFKQPKLRLSGSFIVVGTSGPDEQATGLMFAGSLGAEEAERIDALNVASSDFAPHDLTLDHARLQSARRKSGQETAEVVAKLEESMLLKEALHLKAHTDDLTNVANRSAFVEALATAVAAERDPSSQLAVMVVDVDRFKSINDLHGHLAGDETLRAVASHLTEAVGDHGLVARLGGDEFGILIPALPQSEDLRATIDRIVAIRGRAFEVDNANIDINVTVGVVIQRTEKTGTELLRHADIAMYEARRTHQQPVCIFNPAARRNLDIRRAIRRDLLEAIDASEIELVYHPEVELATGMPSKLEALVRWHHPDFGTIGTDIFIDEVERSQLIQSLNQYILRQATSDALNHFMTDDGPLGVSVNLSPLSITSSLASEVDQVLGLSGFPPELLTLEITEVGGDHDLQRIASILHDVSTIGVTIALDDFGTGHSSLKNLGQLPIGALKMDGSFTTSTSSSRKALELVRATLRVCQMLNLPVVAEGIETAEHAQLFQAMGFQYGQGYYFSRPKSVGEVKRLLGRRLPLDRRRQVSGDDAAAIDSLVEADLASRS